MAKEIIADFQKSAMIFAADRFLISVSATPSFRYNNVGM
jgi:hypothetical protein